MGNSRTYSGETFNTVDEAAAYMRLLRQEGVTDTIEIIIEEGTYYCSSTLKFTSNDCNFILRPYGDDKVVFTGATDVPFSEFSVASDSRIQESSKGKIYKVKLSDYGITPYSSLPIAGHSKYQLESAGYATGSNVPVVSIDSNPMHLARYPNDGYLKVGSVVQNGSASNGKNFKFKYSSDRLSSWSKEKDPWMFGYWYYDWSDQTAPIASISTFFGTGTIESGIPSGYGIQQNQRFYVFNMLCELDEPGEWYYDKETDELFVMVENTDENSVINVSFTGKILLLLDGARDAVVRGIDFCNSMHYFVRVENCENVTVEYCRMKNGGFNAITIVDGHNNTLSNIEVSDIADRAIAVNGGNTTTLEKGNNSVINSTVTNFGNFVRCYSSGIHVAGVGNNAIGNTVSNGPHSAVTLSGNDNYIAKNELYNVLTETADCGVIYIGRSAVSRGNVIADNYIRDIYSSIGSGIYGVYLDDCFCGTTVIGNIFKNIGGNGVFINGGRDNIITKNTFSNINGIGVILADTGTTNWYGDDESFLNTMGLSSGIHLTEPYRKYRNLTNILDDEPRYPKYNEIHGNDFSLCETNINFSHFASILTDEDILSMNAVRE